MIRRPSLLRKGFLSSSSSTSTSIIISSSSSISSISRISISSTKQQQKRFFIERQNSKITAPTSTTTLRRYYNQLLIRGSTHNFKFKTTNSKENIQAEIQRSMSSNSNSNSNSNSAARGAGGGGRSHGKRRGGGGSSANPSGSGRGGGRGRGRRGGRGRGKGRSQNQQQHQQYPQQQQQQQQQARNNFKRCGEKGASAHTVSEGLRIKLTKMMLDLRENTHLEKLEMPSDLSTTERKFMHQLALQLGLKSKSVGKGDTRRITVTKMNSNTQNGGGNGNKDDKNDHVSNNDSDLPLLNMGPIATKELSQYIALFPPTTIEEAEAIETGSSLWNAKQKVYEYGEHEHDSNHGYSLGQGVGSVVDVVDDDEDYDVDDDDDDDDDDDGEDDDGEDEAGDEIIMDANTTNASTMDVKDRVNQLRDLTKKKANDLWSQHSRGQHEAGDELILNTLKELKIDAGVSTTISNTTTAATTTDVKGRVNQLRGLTKQKADHVWNQQQQQQRRKHNQSTDLNKRRKNHLLNQQARAEHPNSKQMQKARAKLPAFGYQSNICDIVRNNRVTILSGDTGCGKSTQIPQFLLDDADIGPQCNIVVTQPRRISAISIAERISSERCEKVGTVVGYNVRLDSCVSDQTQLRFVTPGVLLRTFQSDPELSHITHIIIDEIHERDKHTEFLMIALRELLNRRTNLHVILMSATIQTNELREYWSSVGGINGGDHRPAEVNIPGRTYPVQEFFLEDVLAMTGFVNDSSGMFGGTMDDLDKDLFALLNQNDVGKKQNQQKTQSTLKCIMCNRSGFQSPEELGTHVAFCDGGRGEVDALLLEEKVRSADNATLSSIVQSDQTPEETWDNTPEEELLDDDIDVEELAGLRQGKWDGESPFAVADNIDSSNFSTLTEEEMLNRYQSVHDDQQIDHELILEVMKYICKSSYGDGAILVFLPGWQDISEVMMRLESTAPFSDQSKYSVLPLHSGIPSKEQRFVFQRPRPGVRKVVLATNIAETSITIDDVAFVIDSGRAKEKNYDPHLKTSTLQPVWISQASAKQRKGRAGRTKAGVCFHMYSRRRHANLREFLESEMVRTSLEEIVLQCKKLHLAPGGPDDDDGVPAFLAAALTPPHPKSITNALESLVDMGAIDEETNDLTQLGQCLCMLSLEPRVGKMMIWSYIIGCAKDATGMAVAMSSKSPFIIPPSSMRRDAESKQVELSDGTESDQVTVLNILNKFDNLAKRGKKNQFHGYCKRNYINIPTINMISEVRKNVARELKSIGFDDPNNMNNWYNRHANRGNLPHLQTAICAGLFPMIASRKEGEKNFRTLSNQKGKIHLSSVNSIKGQPLSRKSQMLEYIAFGEIVKGTASYTLNQTTHLASTIPLFLLCGTFRIRPAYMDGEELANISVISVDNAISYQCDKEAAYTLAILRRRLDDIVLHIVSNPAHGMANLADIERKALSTLDTVIKSTFQSSPGRI